MAQQQQQHGARTVEVGTEEVGTDGVDWGMAARRREVVGHISLRPEPARNRSSKTDPFESARRLPNTAHCRWRWQARPTKLAEQASSYHRDFRDRRSPISHGCF